MSFCIAHYYSKRIWCKKLNVFVREYKYGKQSIMFGITKEFAYAQVKLFLSVSGLYISWIVLHYVAAHLYVRVCVQATIMGFILSPFLVPSPHCQALRWAIYNGGNNIIAMWAFIGIWAMNSLKIVRTD